MVKMIVKNNIPSYVTNEGETTAVTYYGQLQTCRHCLELVHNGISCIQNKKLLVQKSFADVAKQQKPKQGAKGPKLLPRKPDTVKQPTQNVIVETQQNIPVNGEPEMPPPENPVIKAIQRNQPVVLLTPISTEYQSSYKQARDDETDDSSTSVNSKNGRGRPPGKKKRQDDANEYTDDNGKL